MLEIRLLGGFEALRDGRSLPNLGPQLSRLLAYLTLHAQHVIELGRLWELFWPDSEKINAVHQSLWRVRTALGPEGGRLTLDTGKVCLDLRNAQVDVIEFTELLQQDDTAALERALALYRGPLLDDWEETWITARREDMHTDYLDTLKSLANAAMEAGRTLKAALYLRRFVAGCPDMEWGWKTLIEVYARSDNRIKALQTYHAYSQFLCEQTIGRNTALRPCLAIEELMRPILQEVHANVVAQIRDYRAPTGRNDPLSPGNAIAPALPTETDDGPVPVGSRYYIERPADREMRMALASIAEFGATIRIKGPRRFGKSSLLARALHCVRQQDASVLYTDWRNLPHADLHDAASFFRALARSIAAQLDLESCPDDLFQPFYSPAVNFERFLRRTVLPVADGPFVWGIDEADRLFSVDYRDDVFAMLRSWHNERAVKPDSPWQRLAVILAYSTEAHLFIANPDRSPFNVGTEISLTDLTLEQAQELNFRYGSPLQDREVTSLYALVGGHPSLLRRCLASCQRGQFDMSVIEAQGDGIEGPCADHLERLRFHLLLDSELTAAVRCWLRDGAPPTEPQFLRLCSSGLMVGATPATMRARCGLYERTLRRHLL
jgi:DNA-binding SARP family transcriptional activator